MASKSLGTLTLDVIAKIGGFEAGLDKAEKEAKKRADAIERAFEGAFSALSAGFATVASAGVAALSAVNAQANAIASYQDLAEKIGDTASNITSLQQAATLSGTAMESVAAASVRLTASLSKTDDESKAVGQAIKALGLEFDSFKSLSPVEQIDAVARALAGFEDGAEKTAVAVALFGKAGAELLPFLNDLSDQSERQITLTDEQIKQADDYTKAQARLKAEFDVFIQQQASQFIPILNQVQQILGEVAKNGAAVQAVTATVKLAIDAAVVAFQAIVVVASDVAFVFQGVGKEIGAIAAQLAALANLDFSGFRAISDAVKEDGVRARAELDKFQARIMAIGQPAYMDDETRRLMARSAANDPVRPRLNVSGLAGGGAASGGGRRGGGGGGRSSVDEAARYLENLQKQLDRTKELTVSEQLLLDIQRGRLGFVSEGQKEQLLAVANQIDATKRLAEEEKARAKEEAEATRERQQLMKEGESLWKDTRTAVEEYSMAMDRLNVLLSEGAISVDVYDRAAAKLGKTFEDTKKPIDEASQQIDDFSKKAAENIQSAIGDGLVDILEGNFNDIGKNFGKLLTRMAAEAVAADITKALFGGAAKGGQGSGLFGDLLSSLGGLVTGGGRALGGPVSPNSLYRINEKGPEVFQAANGNQFLMTGTNGGSVRTAGGGDTFNIYVPESVNRNTGTQIAAEAQRKLAQGRRNT